FALAAAEEPPRNRDLALAEGRLELAPPNLEHHLRSADRRVAALVSGSRSLRRHRRSPVACGRRRSSLLDGCGSSARSGGGKIVCSGGGHGNLIGLAGTHLLGILLNLA